MAFQPTENEKENDYQNDLDIDKYNNDKQNKEKEQI